MRKRLASYGLESKAAKSLASIPGRLNAAWNRGYQNKSAINGCGFATTPARAEVGHDHVQQNYFTLPDAVEG